MIFKIIFVVYLLFVQYLEVGCAACKDKEYSYNETICLDCPGNCTSCVSAKNCTNCNHGFYGDVCNTPCPQNCSSGGCHRRHGHCTYGCKDGQFASEDRTHCFPCPKNCGVCSNVSTCVICVNNYNGSTCSQTCPDTCDGGICNQSTGHCFQCKHGYHWHGGRCQQCPGECIGCANATHCMECHNMYLGPFQGKCFRKCYTNTNNVGYMPNQICGLPSENTQQKQTSCVKIQVGSRYSCTTKGYCIDCDSTGNNCSNRTANDRMCVGYEQCNIECEPENKGKNIKREPADADHALCKQTCSISYDSDSKPQPLCVLTTANITTSSLRERVHIECSQDPEVTANSPEGRSTLIKVAVVFGCLVVFLLIWRVTYGYKQSCTITTRRSRSTEVAQQLEPVQRYCDLPSQVQDTTTLHRLPTVENVYDRAKFVTESRINKEIPSYHSCIQDNVYDTANCSHYIAGDRMNIMLPAPSYPLDIQDKLYDTSNCTNFNKGDCMSRKLPASQYPREIQDTLYNTASCSHLNKCDRMNPLLLAPPYRHVIQDTVYDTANCSHLNKCDRMNIMLPAPPDRRVIQDTVYDTASCSHLNKCDRMNAMLPAPPYPRVIQDTVYDTANCSHLNKCDRMNTMLPAPPDPRVYQDTVNDTAGCSHLNKCDQMNTMLPASSYPTEINDTLNSITNYPQLVTDTREFDTDCFPTQCQYIPGGSYTALNPDPDDHMNNSPASPLQGSELDDMYDYLDINRPETGGPKYRAIADIPHNIDDGKGRMHVATHPKLRNFSSGNAHIDGYASCTKQMW